MSDREKVRDRLMPAAPSSSAPATPEKQPCPNCGEPVAHYTVHMMDDHGDRHYTCKRPSAPADPSTKPETNDERDDYAAIGEELCDVLRKRMPEYNWNESPTEVVGYLLDQIEDASAPQSDDGARMKEIAERDGAMIDLCRTYFEIAAEIVGEDEVRRRRDERLREKASDQTAAIHMYARLIAVAKELPDLWDAFAEALRAGSGADAVVFKIGNRIDELRRVIAEVRES